MEGVSIVICCYNSETRIKKVLEYLAKQEAEKTVNWEIVVVDNASTDKTSEVAKTYWSRETIPLRIVSEPDPGLSNARNTGLKEARYSFVSFIDDDNWVEKKWVQKVYNCFKNDKKIGLLGAHGEAVIEGAKPFWFDRLQMCYAVGPPALKAGTKLTRLYGAGLNIRKTVWDHLMANGFSFVLSDRSGISVTSGGDSELCLAVILAGFELHYDPDLRFYHFMPQGRLNWDYLIKLIESFGRTDPVINIYISSINEYNGYKRYIRENRWMILLYSIYLFICRWPGYLKILFSKKEGRLEHVGFQRAKYRVLESFRVFSDFSKMVSSIRKAKWRQSTFVN